MRGWAIITFIQPRQVISDEAEGRVGYQLAGLNKSDNCSSLNLLTMFGQKNFHHKKFLAEKNFGLNLLDKKNLGQKKFWSKKILFKKILFKKNFVQKNSCSRKCLVKKIFGPKKFLVKNFGEVLFKSDIRPCRAYYHI